jgi:hypothetical protein
MIQRRWLLLAAPLCVVVAASVAFAATTDTEHAGTAELDDVHVVRPIAATDPNFDALPFPTIDLDGVAAFVQGLERQRLEHYLQQIQADEAAAAAQAEADAAAAARPRSSSHASGGGGDSLACIRAHESDSAGGYEAVSSGGTYRGAYQFLPSTWDSTAAGSGRDDLVGVDPASASPSDQDAMASHLYSQAGAQPWGGGC